MPSWPVIGVIGLVTITLAIYPLHWVKVLRKYVTVAVIVTLIYLASQLLTRDVPAHAGHGWGGWMVAVDAIIALSVSWVPVAGDYARHSTSHRAAVLEVDEGGDGLVDDVPAAAPVHIGDHGHTA